MIVTHEIRVDLLRPGLETQIYAVQDDKYSRNLRMSLFVAGASWKIPDGISALVRYRKSDGTGGTYDTIPDGTKAWSVTDNVLTVALAPQVLTVAGPVYLAVTLIKEKQQITTFSVLLHVQPNVSANVGDSENYSYVTGFLPAPQSAKIGQFVRVAAVDENGNVTAVETADVAENASGTYIIVLEQDDNGEYTASASYVQIAEARADGKLVLLQYGIYITHILAGELTESSFLFEPLLHSVEGMPGYIVDIQDNWSTVPVTEAETEVENEIFTVTLEETGDGKYGANAGYMEIAQARAAGKLVLLQYGMFVTHILAGEPTESSFLFEPLLHSVEGMPGYIVDIQDNWSTAPVTETEVESEIFTVTLEETGDGQYSANAGYMEIAQARATEKLVLLRYGAYITHILAGEPTEDSFLFEPLLHSVEGMPGYIVDIQDNWSTASVADSESAVFIGTIDTPISDYFSAFNAGEACYIRNPYNEEADSLWTLSSVDESVASFYTITGKDVIRTINLYSDGSFNGTETDLPDILSGKVDTEHLVTSIDQDSTDDQIPTAKAVYEFDKNSSRNLELAAENETPVLGDELASTDGWTADGWTGDFASGFTHTSGNTNALAFAIPGIAAGKAYVIEFDCSVDYTNTNLLVTIGAAPAMLLYGLSKTNTKVGVITVDTGTLTFTPESEFVGIISNISVREITATSTPRQTIKSVNGNIVSEVRNIGENLLIGVGVGGKTIPGTAGNYVIGDSETFQNNISGFWNVAIGRKCLGANVSGSRNVSIGNNNLMANVEGCRNVSIGNFAMAQTKNAHRNVAIGGDCMSTATGGEDTVAVGFQALYGNTTGNKNVAVGAGTLQQNTEGLGNVAVGYTALSKNKTGRNNVAIGLGAGKSLTSGNGNILIGANADVSSGTYYGLNIGDLLKGSVQSGSAYLLINGGLRLPSIGTEQTENNDVYSEEWTFTLEDGSTVTKKVLMV